MKIWKKLLTLILIFFSFGFIPTTKDDYKLIKRIPFPQPAFLTTDNLGNAFLVVENQLLQYDAEGMPKANYSRSNLGNLYFVDASNPMKVLLFYPDYAKIIILDSKLSMQSEIDLRFIHIDQPLAICNSGENAFWVYDRSDNQLKKVDNNLQVIHQSGDLTQITGNQIQPSMMCEFNGYVYVNNPNTGLLVFDRYGTYYKTIPIEGLNYFQVFDNDILYVKNNHFYRYDSKTFSEKEILIPKADSIRSARIEQHKLYLLTSDTMFFYYF
jgi:hypothetical protein